MKGMDRAILDTNVFVAAGFNRGSASARLLHEAETARITIVWNDATRREIRSVLERIPRLRWEPVAPLFRPEGEYHDNVDTAAVAFVVDPEDRKFAALSRETGAWLVSADDHLLAHADRLDVLTPGAFLRALGDGGRGHGTD